MNKVNSKPLHIATFALIAAVGTPSSAQDPASPQDRIEQAAKELEARTEEISQDNRVIKQYLREVLARLETNRRIEIYKDPQGGQDLAKRQSESLAKESQDATTVVEQFSTLDEDLKNRITQCGSALNNAGQQMTQADSLGSEQIREFLAECSSSDAREILKEIEAAKSEAVQTWQRCRTTLVENLQIEPSTLPSDPTGLSSQGRVAIQKNLEQLKAAGTDLDNCADELEDTYKKITEHEDAALAMASMMNFAATACAASGANPYVCGAAFLIAMLMSLSADGGGDGNGDGDQKEDGTGDGNGSDDGFGTRVGLGGKQGPPEQASAEPAPVEPTPPPISEARGTWGNVLTGRFACDAIGTKLRCLDTATQNNFTFNPDNAVNENAQVAALFRQIIEDRESENFSICQAAVDATGLPIDGVILYRGNDEYFAVQVAVDLEDPTNFDLLKLRFPEGPNVRSGTDLDQQCGTL